MLLPVGRSGWAIAAGYMGLLSVLFVPAPLALIFGISRSSTSRSIPGGHGMGRAIFGIVMSVVGPALVYRVDLATRIVRHW